MISLHLLANEPGRVGVEELRVSELLQASVQIGEGEEEAAGQDDPCRNVPAFWRHTDDPCEAGADQTVRLVRRGDGVAGRLQVRALSQWGSPTMGGFVWLRWRRPALRASHLSSPRDHSVA